MISVNRKPYTVNREPWTVSRTEDGGRKTEDGGRKFALRLMLYALSVWRIAFSFERLPFDPVRRFFEKSNRTTSVGATSPSHILDTIIADDFLLNDDLTGGCSQNLPKIAIASQGNFIIAWEDFRDGNADAYLQRFDTSGNPLGENFRANTDATLMWQGGPAIGIGPQGNFLVAWEDRREGNSDVYAQWFASNGAPIGENFLVNDDGTRRDQRGAGLIIMSDNKSVITFEDWRRDNGDIYAQAYDSLGNPVGNNFLVNDDGPGGNQYHASISQDSLGNFVVVWMDGRSGNWDVYCQLFNNNFQPIGRNFRVNDDVTTTIQWDPNVGRAPNGNFVVVWYDERNGQADIYAQRFDSQGNRLGTNFKVNDDLGTAAQYSPSVAFDGSNFIVVFSDERNGNADIYAQRYDASGNRIGNNFRVNDDSGQESQGGSSVAFFADRRFLIAFSCRRNLNSDIYAQYFDVQGNPVGSNFKINQDSASAQQRVSSIALSGQGNFITVWEDERGRNTDIYGQRFDSQGNLLGDNFLVNDDFSSAYQFYASVASDFLGNFVVVWNDGRNQSYDIYGQRYDAQGSPIGNNFLLNDDVNNAHQWYPWVSMDSSGKWICVWIDFRDGGWEIYGQRYDELGNPLDSNFRVNDVVSGYQMYASVSMSKTGEFVVSWMDDRDGNFNIYCQRYDSAGNRLGTNFRVNEDINQTFEGYPGVAVNDNGDFVIVWEDGRNGNVDIYGQRYNRQGEPLGNNFLINFDYTNEDQYSPTVDFGDNQRFAVVWSDWRFGDGDPEIFAQRFYFDGTPIGGNQMINNPDNFPGNNQWTIGQSIQADERRIGFTWADNRRRKGWDIFDKITDWELIGIKQNSEFGIRNSELKIYPNPFTGSTVLRLPSTVLRAPSSVNRQPFSAILIYDITGRLVKSFSAVDGKRITEHGIIWDGKDERNKRVSPGIYFIKLEDKNLFAKAVLQ